MARSPLLYYITSRAAFPGDEQARRFRLLEKIEEATGCGIDYIQLREKDMSVRELELLAREAMRIVRNAPKKPPDKELRTENLAPCHQLSHPDVALAKQAQTEFISRPASVLRQQTFEKHGSSKQSRDLCAI